MGEVLRLIIFVVLGGVAVTLFVTAAARYLSEENRLKRTFLKGLGGAPDAAVIGHGSGRGVAMSLATQRIVTVWDRGTWRMDYPLDELLGAELDLDGEVAGRVLRGEQRRLLDRSSGDVREVRLRLLFDDPRHPDFELTVWPCRPGRGRPSKPREAIAEANRWLARTEAVLRRTGGPLVRSEIATAAPRRPPPVSAPREPEPELFDDEDEDELAE